MPVCLPRAPPSRAAVALAPAGRAGLKEGESTMSLRPVTRQFARRVWRAALPLLLRGAGGVLGVLCLAVLTAAAASAQTADLAVTVSDAPDPAAAGGIITYTVTVTNSGPSAATNVALVNIFPPDPFNTTTGTAPAGWTCGLGTFSNSVQCTIPSLAAGATAVFHPTYQSAFGVPTNTQLVDDAIVTSTTVDPNPANNLATTTTTVNPGGTPELVADIAVTKTGPTGPVLAGQNATYTITVTNNGPNIAGSPVMDDVTPPDMTFVSVVSPAGWTCNPPAGGGVGLVHCFLPSAAPGGGSLAPGATATFTLTVQALAGTPGGTTTTNLAKVTTTLLNILDTTLANNRVTVNTLIQQASSPTPTATSTSTSTPTRTSTPTSSPTPTATTIPGTGTLQVCKQLTTGTTAAGVFTFTSLPGGPTIPSITVPANTTGPVCVTATASFPPFGTGLPVGTVSVTENVASGFTLQSVTGGTLAGTTATAIITAGQTTTLTFVNTPSVIPPVIPTPIVPFPPVPPSLGLPVLPPPPLQFIPPPPPPLLPPPPPAPTGGIAPRAAFPEVPVIPEAESLGLLVVGLAGLGVLLGWRGRRTKR